MKASRILPLFLAIAASASPDTIPAGCEMHILIGKEKAVEFVAPCIKKRDLIDLLLPDIPCQGGIANDCGTNSYLQCAFDVSPYPFFCAVLGICLYAYGYLGARVGYGYGWLNLSAFGIGFLLSIYGIFQILETIREVRQIAM